MRELLDKILAIAEGKKQHAGHNHCPYCGLSKKECEEMFAQIGERCCRECSKAIQEVVATELDPQQKLLNKYKDKIGKLKLSTFRNERWYKFWLLTNGKLIPVVYSHDKTSSEAGAKWLELRDAGVIRGHINPVDGELNIDTSRKLTRQQIITLTSMFVSYHIKNVFLEIAYAGSHHEVGSSKELSYLLTYGTLDESIEESSIDYPKSDLDLSVWEKEVEGYILRPEVKDKIFKTLDAYEPVDLLDIAREIRIVGSMGSNLYAEDADIDIHLVPNDFSEWNEDKVQEVKKWFISHAQELGAFVGKHPIEVYIQLDPVQDLLSAGVYDMFADEWLVGPKLVSKEYDPYEDFSHIADDIRQNVQDADILMGELKRDVIDYDVISKAMGEMPADVKKRLHLKLKNKLIEIEKDIEGMYAKRKEWTDVRKEASKPKTPEEALKNVELAKKWRDTNAVFKFINRYQYLKVIQDLEELIADDGVVSPSEVDVIRNIVGV